MINFWFLTFTYIIEALIVYFYAKSLYSTKRNVIFTFGIVTLSYIVLMLIYRFIFQNEIFNIFLIISVNIVILFTLFNSSVKSAIFHGFALGITQLVSEFITMYLIAGILQTQSQNIVNEHFEIAAILSRIIYFMLSRLLTLLSFKENSSRSWGKWFGLSLLPLSSILIIIAFRLLTNQVALPSKTNAVLVLSISFLLLVNILIYMLYEQAEKENQKLIELEIINQKNNIDLQYLNLLEKKNEKMQIMSHDYKRHILTLDAMSDSPEVKQYIQDMLGEISTYSRIGKTKNKILDVILSKYTDICSEKNIRFETDILSDNLSFINSADISALFNNLLDNSVEAAEQAKEKYIFLQITNALDVYHKIKIINSCDTPPNVKKGKLRTTKQDRDLHGFGIKSIKKTVNKYNGEMQWEYHASENQFEFTIIIPTVK